MWCRERRLDAEFGQRLIGALGVEGLRAPAVFDGPSATSAFGASSNAAPRWRGCAATGFVRISEQSGRRAT
jgi:hypothetical protein